MSEIQNSVKKLLKLERSIQQQRTAVENVCHDAEQLLCSWPTKRRKDLKVLPEVIPVVPPPQPPEEIKLANKLLLKADKERKKFAKNEAIPSASEDQVLTDHSSKTLEADIKKQLSAVSISSKKLQTVEALVSADHQVGKSVSQHSTSSFRAAGGNPDGTKSACSQIEKSTRFKKPKAPFQNAPFKTTEPVRKIQHKPTRTQLLRGKANLNQKAESRPSSKMLSASVDSLGLVINVPLPKNCPVVAKEPSDAGSASELSKLPSSSSQNVLPTNNNAAIPISTNAFSEGTVADSSSQNLSNPAVFKPSTMHSQIDSGFNIISHGSKLALPRNLQKAKFINKKLRQQLWTKAQNPAHQEICQAAQAFLNKLDDSATKNMRQEQTALLKTFKQMNQIANNLKELLRRKIPNNFRSGNIYASLRYRRIFDIVVRECKELRQNTSLIKENLQEYSNFSEDELNKTGRKPREEQLCPELYIRLSPAVKYKTRQDLIRYHKALFKLQQLWLQRYFLEIIRQCVGKVKEQIQLCDNQQDRLLIFQSLYSLICTTRNSLPIIVGDAGDE